MRRMAFVIVWFLYYYWVEIKDSVLSFIGTYKLFREDLEFLHGANIWPWQDEQMLEFVMENDRLIEEHHAKTKALTVVEVNLDEENPEGVYH